MRTTIIVDDRVGEAALGRARREGMSFSAFVARALEEYLTRRSPDVEAPPFRLVTVGGGGPQPGLDLDRTSELLEHGCTLITTDSDFGRFPHLRWRHPLAAG